MFKELIDAIQNGVKPEPVVIGGREFATRPVFEGPEPRLMDALETSTLQSVVDYIEGSMDANAPAPTFIHIERPTQVNLYHDIDSTNRRSAAVIARYEGHSMQFGQKYDQAEFITLLRSQFVPSQSREELQRFVGSLTDESSLKLEDDGVSQRTVAKRGIATLDRVENNAPIVLAPFRTFPEVEQPESEFILRLHRRDGDVPLVSLHESDNQAWKIEALQRIAEFFRKQNVSIPVLA